MGEPGFWNDQPSAQAAVQQVKSLKATLEPFVDLEARVRSAEELHALLELEPDSSLDAELDADVVALEDEVEALRLRSLLSGPDDHRDAQLEISAGAGGTEAQDWAQMLMRMYTRWAERRGYAVDVLDLSEGEEAGIKGAVLELKGPQAFGLLKGETGVHRLVSLYDFVVV
jgi:peptide chain release factor 2